MFNQYIVMCFVAAVLSLGAAGTALADPPGRVGRLSYLEGTVSFRPAGQDQWAPAILNYPVVSGSSVWTEPQSRVEIQVGSAEVRMDQQTELDVQRLDDQAVQVQVPKGVVNLHLRVAPAPGEYQVATPVGQVELMRQGSYRIEARPADVNNGLPRVEVVVLEGQAHLQGARVGIDIMPGEGVVASGSPLSFSLVEASATPFDNWALARERREMESEAARYASPEATGVQDLDQYGQWITDPEVGPVWVPAAVAADWAPYRYGHWAFVPPWGWTWIDDAPWGFAPFHYGRWTHFEGHWAWCPGIVVARPVYAPALVAFFGGGGWSVPASAGARGPAVGWVPLGPREVFHPYYRVSPAYVRNVNVTNVTNVTTITNVTNTVAETKFVNERAATVIPAEAFTHAVPAHTASLVVSPRQVAQAQVVPTMTRVQPTPAARAGVPQPSAAAAATLPHAPVPPWSGTPRPEMEHPQAPQPWEERPPVARPPFTQPQVARPTSPEPTVQRAAPSPQFRPSRPAVPPPQVQMAEPPVSVQHPVQQSHLAPSPQGWVRQPSVSPHPPAAPPHESDHRKDEHPHQ
jgi:hypothetical protein